MCPTKNLLYRVQPKFTTKVVSTIDWDHVTINMRWFLRCYNITKISASNQNRNTTTSSDGASESLSTLISERLPPRAHPVAVHGPMCLLLRVRLHLAEDNVWGHWGLSDLFLHQCQTADSALVRAVPATRRAWSGSLWQLVSNVHHGFNLTTRNVERLSVDFFCADCGNFVAINLMSPMFKPCGSLSVICSSRLCCCCPKNNNK